MFRIILIILLIGFSYTLGADNSKKETLKLIKQYWEDSSNVDEFWSKFTTIWNRYVGENSK